MKILKQLRDPAWASIFAAAALALAVFLFWLQGYLNRHELTYQIVSQTPLLNINPEEDEEIQLLFKGEPVENVYLSVIRLYNSGGSTIRSDDYDKGLPIEFNFGSNVKVLSSEVLSTIPNGLTVSLHNQANAITIDPVLLNVGGEIRLKVISIGSNDQIAVKSSISGINEILRARNNNLVSYILFSLGGIFVGIIISLLVESIRTYIAPPKNTGVL